MMRGKRLSALALVSALVVGAAGCQSVPTQLSQVTWAALQDGRRQGAEGGAPDIWSVAQARFDSAWIAIEAQNRLWFFERDFEPAESLLVWSGRTAREAVKAAYSNRERQKQVIDSTIAQLTKDVEAHRLGINGHIARIPLRKALTETEVMVDNVREAYATGDIDKAFTAIEEAEDALKRFDDRLDIEWVDPRELPNWNRMVHETVSWSKQTGDPALVVVKMDRRAYLLRGGRVIETFPVEFGYRAWTQKMWAGDGATPEGVYQITKWRDRDTRYYKALNLDYPNDTDKRRFAVGKRTGAIPRNARIGGNIEIHGEGGRGEDWTLGCLALSNRDMDRLMAKLSVGNRVAIVREVTGWPD
jgi:hypothetical protein